MSHQLVIYRQQDCHFIVIAGCRWYVDSGFVRQEINAGRAFVLNLN